MNRLLLLLAALCLVWSSEGAAPRPFELREGDRVVFIGDTLIEREQHFGYVELALTLQHPDRHVTFRNLGWSADTPEGQSRVSFDWQKGQAEWFRQLMEQIKQTQPTVVVLGYGMANSFDGPAGLEKFTTSYNKLIDAILELNKDIRFVLLSPIRHEKLPAPLPDPTRHNEMLAAYVKAIQSVAEKRGYPFVNLFEQLAGKEAAASTPLTDNGIHLNANGYRAMASAVSVGLASPAKATALAQHEELRQLILKKNQLFFHRWRPQNSTYLFLFRKHEQGKNAQEIPQFDPLVHAEEEKIAKLRRQEPKDTPVVAFRPARQVPVTENPATPFRPQPLPEFQLADSNLEVTLWAENPLLAKPIQMSWDERGRLWVASSSVYPQIAPGQEQEDKILILEDADRDGTADKTIVFADGLLIPTGIEPGDGGAYVGQSTELLHFKDTNGDGIADERRVVLSGFGTEDTHHILHTLRWGHDGQLHMNQSIYIHSHIETPHGVVRLNSGGTLALRPDTMELGVTMKGLINGWGHDFDEFGQSFQTDGAGGNGINWIIPQAQYVAYAGARRILGSVSPGGYPKFCGLEMIKSEAFPKDWQGSAVTCDFRANRVVRFEITEQGAAYVTKQHEFMRSTNVTFRPIDVKQGPDGALYIADWSNPIIQHGEVDFRDPRRDRVHGRIWRVAYKGAAKTPLRNLAEASNTELLDQLMSSNGWAERQARRLFIERSRESRRAGVGKAEWDRNPYNQDEWLLVAKSPAVPEFQQMRRDLAQWRARHPEPSAQLEALWLMQALSAQPFAASPATDPLPLKTLKELLESKDGRVRAAAVRVLGAWAGNTPGLPSMAPARIKSDTALELLANRVQDDHPRVRVEALRALARIPNARAAELALGVMDKGEVEGFLEYALWLTINDLAAPWAAAVESGSWKVQGREKQLQYALKAIEPKLATRLMARVIGDQPLPRDGSGGLIELIGQAGGPEQLRKLFNQAIANPPTFTPEATARALRWLGEAARLRNARPSGDLTPLATLVRDAADANVRAAAAKLAGTWKLASVAPVLAETAADANAPETLRAASIDGLRDLGGKQAIASLRQLTTDQSASVRRAAAAALAGADLNGSMPQIVSVLAGSTREDETLALWRSMLGARGASAAFARSLSKTNLPEVVARAGVRIAREGGRNEPDLILALNKAGGISDTSAGLTDDEIHAIAYQVSKGDPNRGEMVYRRKEMGCMMCHSIGGAGGKVGPDMTSLGASTPVADYIVESVLLPNKKVKEGYNSVMLTTRDDEEISGNLVREDSEQVILRDATNREISVPKRTIKERRMGGSLMPGGIVDVLPPQERLDLYAFLAQLGKPGPFDATKQNVARTWYINPKVGTVNADEMLKSDLRGKDWTPIQSTVSGALPKGDVLAELGENPGTFWAASRFQTAKAGPVRLAINGTVSPKAWVDGQPIGGDKDLTVDLPAGQHTFFIKITPGDINGPLRLESNDATFLTE